MYDDLLSPITKEDVQNVIKQLKSNKASGPNGLSLELLKLLLQRTEHYPLNELNHLTNIRGTLNYLVDPLIPKSLTPTNRIPFIASP